jgi:ABC-2 type transport system ATP-binding protein
MPIRRDFMAYATPSDLDRLQAVEMQSPAASAVNITKKFGDQIAVQDISFDVPKGSIFGFIGPSGAGKTTTIRLLTGIYKPTTGEVKVLGKRPEEFTQGLRARIGYMPQLFVLYPNLTVWENLNFAASIYGMSLARRKRLEEVLDFVELSEHKGKLARDTSGGMQRRLSLAATLLHKPELIFLDEPTAGVDPILRRKFWDHFEELQKSGSTLLVTTQYVNEAAYCDYVAVIAEGKLVVVDTPEGIRHRAYGGDVVDIITVQPLQYQEEQRINEMPFVRGKIDRTGPNHYRLVVDEASTAVPDLLEWSSSQDISVESIEEYLPPFDDIFVELMQERENGEKSV